ncbi:unnamed protein product [Discula destructiva]
MPRLQAPPTLPFLVVFLVLCFIGMSYNERNTPSYGRSDRADGPLLAQRNNGCSRGLKYIGSPTGTSASAAPTETCYNPPLSVPASEVDVDKLCKCDTYLQPDENPIPYYNAGFYGGKAYCWSTCKPTYPNQTRIVDANESFSQCMNACDGSFEKAKRTTSDDYWFCHGVNFIQGELCEFIGQIAYYQWPTPGVQCFDNGLSPSG